MKIKKVQEQHIKSVGEARFNSALGAATLSVRNCRSLVGLDKLRDPIAFEAAMRATGADPVPLSLDGIQKHWSAVTQDFQEMCEKLLEEATAAACTAIAPSAAETNTSSTA